MLAGILAALSINVAGNWLLVPKYGFRASAYLTVASSATYLLLLFVLTPMRELRDAIAIDKTRIRTELQSDVSADFLSTPS